MNGIYLLFCTNVFLRALSIVTEYLINYFSKIWKLAISSCAGGAEVLTLVSLALLRVLQLTASLLWQLGVPFSSLKLKVHSVPFFSQAFSQRYTLYLISEPVSRTFFRGHNHKSGFHKSFSLSLIPASSIVIGIFYFGCLRRDCRNERSDFFLSLSFYWYRPHSKLDKLLTSQPHLY